MEKKTIKFTPSAAGKFIEADIAAVDNAVLRAFNYLDNHGEDIEDLRKYIAKGYDYKRRQVLENCKKWLADSHAPEYLHEEMMQKAYDSLGAENDYIDGLPAHIGLTARLWNGTTIHLTPDDIEVTESGWRAKDEIIYQIHDAHTRTLDEEEMADFGLFTELCSISKKLRARGYTFESRASGRDELEDFETCETDGKRAEQMLYLYNSRYDGRLKK